MVSVGQFSIHTMTRTSSLWATGSLTMYNESFRALRISHNLRNFTSLYLMPLSSFIHPLFQLIFDKTLDRSSLLWVHHNNGSGLKESIFLIRNSALSSQKVTLPLAFFIAVLSAVIFAILMTLKTCRVSKVCGRDAFFNDITIERPVAHTFHNP